MHIDLEKLIDLELKSAETAARENTLKANIERLAIEISMAKHSVNRTAFHTIGRRNSHDLKWRVENDTHRLYAEFLEEYPDDHLTITLGNIVRQMNHKASLENRLSEAAQATIAARGIWHRCRNAVANLGVTN